MDTSKINLKDLSTDIFSAVAQSAASHISMDKNANKSSQLRKFYDELAMWHTKITHAQDRQAEYDAAAPFIHMLAAKVAYAQARKHVDDNFVNVFNRMLKQIDSPETLKNAKLFFEAVLGFRKANEH